jgi:hypothetical protein
MAMKKMTGAKKPVAKMTSTGSAKKTTVSRGSKSQTQVGNDNQRERYNQGRDKNTKIQIANRAYGNAPGTSAKDKKAYGKDMGGATAYGDGGKVSTAEAKKAKANLKKLKKGYGSETVSAYNAQRKGGKVGSKNAGKSNPMPRKRYKAPKGA